jgi:DNA-binding transcriptional ArsR family regulator
LSRGPAVRVAAASRGVTSRDAASRDPTPRDARRGGASGDDPSAGDPFEALGDPNRRAILAMLGKGGRSVREIADALPISRPAVSRHLRVLKEAGLVEEEAAGTRRIYRLQEQGIEAVRGYLERLWGDAAVRFRLTAENTRPER